MSNFEPKGDIVSGPPALLPDQFRTLIGQHSILLIPLTEAHIPDLYLSLGGSHNDHLYTYLPGGPFHDLPSFTTHFTSLLDSPVFFPYTIMSSSTSEPRAVGIIALMNITPPHRTLEIGHVLFSTSLQRTPAATEATYLLMRHAFEDLHYHRVEWKTNSFNDPSLRAATRLGFVKEGVFRKHMVVKGRRRDSVWFSCLDGEWFEEGKAGVKRGLEGWLEEGNFDEGGRQRRRLEEVREGLV
ncbi:acyl-CoA N-acyltransferase [Rhexocercosporidium sp. MPI-PUGE-AT-0058]|nr:acyl-CoA N-acyltransferase [Rhexocercosporidium sp. MPI-PUGE-AT-0058]